MSSNMGEQLFRRKEDCGIVLFGSFTIFNTEEALEMSASRPDKEM